MDPESRTSTVAVRHLGACGSACRTELIPYTIQKRAQIPIMNSQHVENTLSSTVPPHVDPPVKITTQNISRISSFRVFSGHTNMVFSTAFNLSGSHVASASGDCNIRLWSLNSPELEEGVLTGHSRYIPCVIFSPDGVFMASASHDRSIRLWHASTHECFLQYNHPDHCTGVAFSPNGERIATACHDRIVRIWPTDQATCLLELLGHESPVFCVQWTPSGDSLASAGEDANVRIWDSVTGHCRFTLQGHDSWIWNLSFTPDGAILASSCGDTTVRLWDVEVGGTIGILQCERVNPSVAISPDGSFLVSGALDLLQVWDMATATKLHTIRLQGDQRVEGVSISRDQTKLAFAWGNDVYVYSLLDEDL